ncbi:NADH-ubiquinone oxidoreductase-F iron-sulfur binding region domain-containing protein [Pseudonocardia sp. TRM90224]|uniref:NADH-ubiquinone oxidoreductase-F iron-sulfur binding region domain-containing protein n=1 Tax=Pseudonocardia sp. TRM90224 TaxID=2812678 RepID=UPI001E419115|nr:NADH-ubiquinone oxidoreductase-F iron-sulfur binding region domain-containing protein [Pseudonocardia sp. TRM90224]
MNAPSTQPVLVVASSHAGGAVHERGRECYEQHLAGGGDSATGWTTVAIMAALWATDLRGRGGAGFPVLTKVKAVAAETGPRVLVANGEEGEPASVKDRYLMRTRPHLVLEGMLLARRAAGAERMVLYASDEVSLASMRAAVAERGAPVEIFAAEPGFVSGEETAVVRAIDGGPAKPTAKPPRPFERGVGGRPTLVLNVESLARIALVTRSPRTDVMVTLSGGATRPVLTEAEPTTRLGQLCERFGLDATRGFLAGGFSGGLLPPSAAELPLLDTRLRESGSMLGCAAFIALGADDCPVDAAADVLAFFDRSNAGQCGSCVKGTGAMAGVVARLRTAEADPDQLDRLAQWSQHLRGRGACGTLDAAATAAGSLLAHFSGEVEAHLAAPCPRCARLPRADGTTRFRVCPPDGRES